jgi:hypothetical protein
MLSATYRFEKSFSQLTSLTVREAATYTARMRQPSPRRTLGTAVVLAAALLTVTLSAQTVQRVIYVGVTDKSNNPVPGLGPSDFVVREDRLAREVVKVEPATEPMSIALLIDNSQAAEPFQRDLREATAAFITAIGADSAASGRHQIALITLASRPTILNDYISDQPRLMKNALGLFAMPESGTYFLDGVIETSRGILKRALARPVIVAILTEGPELSERRYQAVLEPLRDSGAALSVVTIGMLENLSQDRSVVIEQGSRSTGGRVDGVLVSTGLPSMMKQVANGLTHQYRVTYARPQTLVPPEQVTVSVSKPGLTARGTPVKEPRPLERK